MDKRIIILWGGVALAVAAIAGIMYRDLNTGQYCAGEMNIAPGTQFGGEFSAINHLGETVTQADVITEPTLIYFGYTFCPDICPLDTARNARAVELLEAQGISVTPTLISIDPERDTPEVLAEFVKYTHPKMIGITGTNEQIDKIKKLYSAYGEKREGDDPEYYLVDHSAFTYLMTPNGFVAGYDRALTDQQIADNISCHAANGDLD